MSSSSQGASRLPAASDTSALYFSPSVRNRSRWLIESHARVVENQLLGGVVIQYQELAMNVGLPQERLDRLFEQVLPG